jgi:methionine-S-sulfoxide reductase
VFLGHAGPDAQPPGVVHTRVGYTGGDVPNVTYRTHGSHAEAIEIQFDPTRLSYRDHLEFFFQIHDPTTLNRQSNDVGTSYRSEITADNERPAQSASDRRCTTHLLAVCVRVPGRAQSRLNTVSRRPRCWSGQC